MKKILLLVFVLLFSLDLVSQDTLFVYLDKNKMKTSRENAEYILQVTRKTGHLCVTNMKANRELINYVEYKSLNPKIEEGRAVYYSDGGTIYSAGFYENGIPSGNWVFYKNNLPDTVSYEFKQLCSEKKLNDVPYYFESNDQLKKTGAAIKDSLTDILKSCFHMPARAKTDDINNFSTVLECVIDNDGNVECPKLLYHVHPDIEREIFRILSQYHYSGKISKPFKLSPVLFTYNELNNNLISDQILQNVDEIPKFPGGDLALCKFISDHLEYPEEAKENNIQAKVIVTFCISYDGTIENIGFKGFTNASLMKESIRVVKLLPQFIPAMNNGKFVNFMFTLPIDFQLKH